MKKTNEKTTVSNITNVSSVSTMATSKEVESKNSTLSVYTDNVEFSSFHKMVECEKKELSVKAQNLIPCINELMSKGKRFSIDMVKVFYLMTSKHYNEEIAKKEVKKVKGNSSDIAFERDIFKAFCFINCQKNSDFWDFSLNNGNWQYFPLSKEIKENPFKFVKATTDIIKPSTDEFKKLFSKVSKFMQSHNDINLDEIQNAIAILSDYKKTNTK